MRRSHLFRVGVLVALVASLATGVASASTSKVTAAQAASPFDSQTVFCTKSAAPAGTRNASSPGVTKDSITVADTSLDVAALRRLGVDQPDFHQAFEVFFNEINKCGGINGRKLVLKKTLYNPAAPDQAGHLQALCLKVTEDYKALVNLGVGMPQMQRCVSITHKTISFSAAETISDDFAGSNGRIVSIYPAADRLGLAFIKDGAAQSLFKGKQVGVLSAQVRATATNETRSDYVDQLKKVGVDAELEMLPCTGTVCTQGVTAAISRLKAKGVDIIVLAHYVPVTTVGTVFRELQNQSMKAAVWGPDIDALHSDSNMANFIRGAGTDGGAWAAKYGWYSTAATVRNGWRTGQIKEAPFGRMCQDTLAKALGQKAYQYNETDIGNARWPGIATVCTYTRNLARAIWSLGNNVTTERLTAALKNQTVVDRRDTSPVYRNKVWYSGSDVNPPVAITFKFQYPCQLPKPTSGACMISLDRPARARTIKY
ncbi:MAG: hypothetical protein JWN67_3544 [Actinomycetia bacterium]|nr:hypothetical protein [Actinomycetes bacterium]